MSNLNFKKYIFKKIISKHSDILRVMMNNLNKTFQNKSNQIKMNNNMKKKLKIIKNFRNPSISDSYKDR